MLKFSSNKSPNFWWELKDYISCKEVFDIWWMEVCGIWGIWNKKCCDFLNATTGKEGVWTR